MARCAGWRSRSEPLSAADRLVRGRPGHDSFAERRSRLLDAGLGLLAAAAGAVPCSALRNSAAELAVALGLRACLT